MLFERIVSPGLAHYSYLIGDGQALVIDLGTKEYDGADPFRKTALGARDVGRDGCPFFRCWIKQRNSFHR